jgi:hypothetical protein
MLDILDSDCGVPGILGPPPDAKMPDAGRWIWVLVTLPVSLPLADAAELGTPRADARLYRELMLIRLLTGPSDMDVRGLRRVGSKRPRCEAVSAVVPACKRVVSGSSGSATVTAKSRGENVEVGVWSWDRFCRFWELSIGFKTTVSAESSLAEIWVGRGGGGMDTSALSAWVVVVPGSTCLAFWMERADEDERL